MADLIRQSVLHGISECLLERGVDPSLLFERHGISSGALQEPDKLFSYATWNLLLNDCAEQTQCPHFGLLVSTFHTVDTLGMLGFAMQQAPNVLAAQKIFQRNFYLHTDAAAINSTTEGDIFFGIISIDLPNANNVKQVVDVSLGTGLNIYRFLCGNAAKLLGAYFMHDAPEDVQPYKALFNCPLYFNADYNGLSYHSSILIQPIEQHSEKMHELMQAHLKELERQHPGDIRQQVALTIRAALHTGDTSIELVAASMNMSRRTLQKKLQDNGTNFRKVLDEVRGDVARTYLAESKVSMTRLADILAYSELSAFSRAFKRWFGVAPQRWHSNKI